MLGYIAFIFVTSYLSIFLPICFLGWCGQTKAGLEFEYKHPNFMNIFCSVYKKSVIPLVIIMIISFVILKVNYKNIF